MTSNKMNTQKVALITGITDYVILALIKRFHEAQVGNASEVVISGAGILRREFLYMDDMVAASVFVMLLDKETYDSQTEPMQGHLNVSFGSDITIAELANAVAQATSWLGKISFDTSKPDESARKWMKSSRLNGLGWIPHVSLQHGLSAAYTEFLGRLELSST